MWPLGKSGMPFLSIATIELSIVTSPPAAGAKRNVFLMTAAKISLSTSLIIKFSFLLSNHNFILSDIFSNTWVEYNDSSVSLFKYCSKKFQLIPMFKIKGNKIKGI